MLPSSSSQLARYGQVSHYKKFWLLQTQLEKQEQSASSSLSLGSTSMHTVVKEHNSKTTSPIVAAVSGDHHHHHHHAAIAASANYGTCRADIAASTSIHNCSGRVINGGSTFNDPACVRGNSYMHMPGYSTLERSADMLRVHGRSRLSLAVNCENVSGVDEYESSESCSLEGVSRASSAASVHLRFHHQLHGVIDRHMNSPLSPNNSPLSAALVSSAHLRTCSLCGTTKTPLWRSGPDGPKSLCNACGIRVKKTKRLEAALQASGGSSPSPSTMSAYKGPLKRKLSSGARKDPTFHKKKRSTSIHFSPVMAKQGLSNHETLGTNPGGSWDSGNPKLAQLLPENGRGCANIFAEDVEEAAVLLMALSCGLVLS